MRRHRAVGSEEHDPQRSLLHGCCAVCVEPWPCSHERDLASRELAAFVNWRARAEEAEAREEELWEVIEAFEKVVRGEPAPAFILLARARARHPGRGPNEF